MGRITHQLKVGERNYQGESLAAKPGLCWGQRCGAERHPGWGAASRLQEKHDSGVMLVFSPSFLSGGGCRSWAQAEGRTLGADEPTQPWSGCAWGAAPELEHPAKYQGTQKEGEGGDRCVLTCPGEHLEQAAQPLGRD